MPADSYIYQKLLKKGGDKKVEDVLKDKKQVQKVTLDMLRDIRRNLETDYYSHALSILEFEKKILKINFDLSTDSLIDFEYKRLKEIIEKRGKIKPLYDDEKIFDRANIYK